MQQESTSRESPNPIQECKDKLHRCEEQAQIYVALDPSGCNHQYTMLEAQGEYEGKSLTFLIDAKSSHSFMSPSTAKRLRVEAQPTGKKLRALLANGSSILADEQVLELSF